MKTKQNTYNALQSQFSKNTLKNSYLYKNSQREKGSWGWGVRLEGNTPKGGGITDNFRIGKRVTCATLQSENQ